MVLLAAALAVRGRVNPSGNLIVSAEAPGVGLPSGAAAALSLSELTLAAATALETAHAKGLGGITFEIVQTSTLNAKAGGPRINIPDLNSRGSLGQTDAFQVASVIEHGAYTSDGFWMEMRDGPAKGEKPDFDHATYKFGAIVKVGKTYREEDVIDLASDRPRAAVGEAVRQAGLGHGPEGNEPLLAPLPRTRR